MLEYSPRPLNTQNVQLPQAVLDLSERVAENAHEVWSRERINGGWRWGATRCNNTKQHPDLVPYSDLTEQDKQYDRDMSLETLKLIHTFGFRIQRPEAPLNTSLLESRAQVSSSCFTTLASGEQYVPQPVDTSAVDLCPDLESLANRLAQNAHDVWAAKRLEQGWTYGAHRDDAKKLHNCLLPYLCLSESERQMDLATAKEALKVVVRLGCSIVKSGDAPVKSLGESKKLSPVTAGRKQFGRSSSSMKRMLSRSTSLDVDLWCKPTLITPVL